MRVMLCPVHRRINRVWQCDKKGQKGNQKKKLKQGSEGVKNGVVTFIMSSLSNQLLRDSERNGLIPKVMVLKRRKRNKNSLVSRFLTIMDLPLTSIYS